MGGQEVGTLVKRHVEKEQEGKLSRRLAARSDEVSCDDYLIICLI